MRTLPRTHGVGGQITRVTIAGCNRLQSADAIRGAFHAPSEPGNPPALDHGTVFTGNPGGKFPGGGRAFVHGEMLGFGDI